MSRHNTDIQGNASISRNAYAGGDAHVEGDVLVGHNLRVGGWIDAPNIKGPLKGLFSSAEDLRKAYPRPQPGWMALVGDTLPASVWRAEGKEWKSTGQEGGSPTIWPDRLERDVKEIREAIADEAELRDEAIAAALSGLRIQEISEDGYEALLESGDTDERTLYLIKEEEEEEQ